MADLRVHSPARRTRVRLRGEALRKSAHLKAIRSAAAPTVAALGLFECARRRAATLFARSRSASAALPRQARRYAASGCVACVSTPLRRGASCHTCVSARLTRTVPRPRRSACSSGRVTPVRSSIAERECFMSSPAKHRLLATASSLFGSRHTGGSGDGSTDRRYWESGRPRPRRRRNCIFHKNGIRRGSGARDSSEPSRANARPSASPAKKEVFVFHQSRRGRLLSQGSLPPSFAASPTTEGRLTTNH